MTCKLKKHKAVLINTFKLVVIDLVRLNMKFISVFCLGKAVVKES